VAQIFMVLTAQVLRAFKEAESFDGLHYNRLLTCIEHGIMGGLTNSFAKAKLA
jgi:hypothetical protein